MAACINNQPDGEQDKYANLNHSQHNSDICRNLNAKIGQTKNDQGKNNCPDSPTIRSEREAKSALDKIICRGSQDKQLERDDQQISQAKEPASQPARMRTKSMAHICIVATRRWQMLRHCTDT